MFSPRIVVGAGVWNEEQYLRETIPTVLNQTMPYFMFYIHDNGSTDGSWDILQEFARQDDRIVLDRSPTNLRCPDAANKAWTFCTEMWPKCRWFIGFGTDDRMDSDYLSAILTVADARPDVNLVFSPARFIDHPERGVYTYPPYNPMTSHLQLQVPGWRAFTRELWNDVGPEWTGINEGSDWEWIVRASVKGVLRPHQMLSSYLSLRVRKDRVAQSDLADKPMLSRRLHHLVQSSCLSSRS